MVDLVFAYAFYAQAQPSHDLLLGTIFTGTVTLVLGLVATVGTRRRRVDQTVQTEEDVKDIYITDLIRQRDALQKKVDRHPALLASQEEQKLVLRREIERMITLLWENGINPVTGQRKQRPNDAQR
jgi:hypothetical protein